MYAGESRSLLERFQNEQPVIPGVQGRLPREISRAGWKRLSSFKNEHFVVPGVQAGLRLAVRLSIPHFQASNVDCTSKVLGRAESGSYLSFKASILWFQASEVDYKEKGPGRAASGSRVAVKKEQTAADEAAAIEETGGADKLPCCRRWSEIPKQPSTSMPSSMPRK